MSAKDSQFIDQALAHPWMFWVYFWKWPRIVRQACAEYALLAKERDAAKEAHEQAVRANKIVRDWIHVTHRLDMTADMRAIWTAGKRLSALLLFLALTLSANAQLPPILRNQWTTNANPLALKVISTNGVHAATNVWELDFTNTATVTVSAVSNANKVMVSFTGSGGSGESLWTNTGPFTALIADTNLVRIHSHQTVFGSNDNSHVTITNGGIATIGWGQFIGETPADSVGNYTRAHEGGIATASFANTTNCWVHGWEGGFGGGFFYQSSNCFVQTVEGGHGAISAERSADCSVSAIAGFSFGGFTDTKDSSVDISRSSLALGDAETCSNITVRAQSPSVVIGGANSSDNIDFHAKGGISAAAAFNSRDIAVTVPGNGVGSGLAIGSFNSATNSTLSGQFGIAVGSFSGQSNSVTSTDGLAFGRVASNERILAQGSSSVAAFALGRNVVSTNNWTFGIHYTNTVPLSLAVGANGTTQFRAASNSVVIRSATAPTVGQILTATDTSGTVGWSNAPAASGGGIASIYTNNVLAGGPGLTELEFTNTSSVTWTATTNAGRVTMSATSASGAQTPWASDIDAASFSLTNFNALALTNGAWLQQPGANITSFTNSQLQLWSGMSNRVALIVTNAETAGTHTNLVEFLAPKMSNGSIVTIRGTWQNDTINFPAALLMDITDVASGGASPFAQFKYNGATAYDFSKSGLFLGAGAGAVGNNGGALTLVHANGDDIRIKSANPILAFYNGSTVFQGSIASTAQGTLTVKTNLVTVGNLNVGGAITNDTLTASTVLAADATKEIVSIANGAGVLTNDGAGVVGYMNLGSFGGGSSSLTNALLHAGPTNGSVDALILTAGNGVTLTTSGTNRIAAIDTNVVAEISDLLWTNDGTAVMIAADTNRVRHFVNQSIFGTNGFTMVISNGAAQGAWFDPAAASPGAYVKTIRGSYGGAYFYNSSGSSVYAEDGSFGGGMFDAATNNQTYAFKSAISLGEFRPGARGNLVESYEGSFAGGYHNDSWNNYVTGAEGAHAGGSFDISSNNVVAATAGFAFGNFENSTNSTVDARAGLGFGNFELATGATMLIRNGGIAAAYFTSSNGSVSALQGSIAVGSVLANERLYAGTNAAAFGRDVASTDNNWSFGLHYTNTVPLSLAVGTDGTTQFRAASNSIVIRSGTAPTVGQILTATDTSGTVGWSNAPAASGGGIASIFTNNVLAGGPGLTELEFTNTATVTWAATTNAGRVTMSATSAGGGSGIATNAGTGWNTSFLQPSVTDKAVTVTQIADSKTNTVEILGAAGGVGTFGTNFLSIAGGVITNDSRLIDSSVTWSNSAITFTGLRLNVTDTASASGSLLLDLRKSGTSKFTIDRLGNVASTDINGWTLTGHANGTTIANGSSFVGFGNVGKGITFTSDGRIHWSETSNPFGATKAILDSPSVGIIRVFTNLAIVGSLSVTNSTTLANVTASRVAVFNAGQQITNSAGVDTTELEYLDGVTSAIQTQLNGNQVGSAVLTNLAATRAVTNMTVTTITNVGVSLYTVPSGCTYIWVECIGGGGGGGGVDGAASQSAAGGGGGSGAYCSTNIGSPAASYIVTVGTNGLGGAGTGGNAGTIGGTTLFTNILTALGGSGGAGKSSAAAVSITLGGAGALETATGRVYTGGNPGHNGICVSGTLAISGGGAGSHFGGGGVPQTAAVGANATGKGAGGSGAAVITNADRNGGNGSPGVIVIREFYQ